MKDLLFLLQLLTLSTDYSGLATVFIIGAIAILLLIAGILFLIIYGIIKKKKGFWLTGAFIAIGSLLLYFFYLFQPL